MKKVNILFLFILFGTTGASTQTTDSKPKYISTNVKSEKQLTSSILLWMRTDTLRKAGMDRWKGSHAKIISANKGLWEYRQIHLAENNKGLWPTIKNVETTIPLDRKIDGIADVTLKNFFSIFKGKEQNKLASKDEINIFKRTILYAAFPNHSKWYETTNQTAQIEARSIVFFRIKEGVSEKDFNQFIMEELTPTLANLGLLNELRSKVYNPWKQKQWNTPNVLHDNTKEVQFQASLMLGFTDQQSMGKFFNSDAVKNISDRISIFCSAVHAYEIAETITFVKNGIQLN